LFHFTADLFCSYSCYFHVFSERHNHLTTVTIQMARLVRTNHQDQFGDFSYGLQTSIKSIHGSYTSRDRAFTDGISWPSWCPDVEKENCSLLIQSNPCRLLFGLEVIDCRRRSLLLQICYFSYWTIVQTFDFVHAFIIVLLNSILFYFSEDHHHHHHPFFFLAGVKVVHIRFLFWKKNYCWKLVKKLSSIRGNRIWKGEHIPRYVIGKNYLFRAKQLVNN
jgi:hypothetical protein